MIDWLNPSDDILEARRIGFEEGVKAMEDQIQEWKEYLSPYMDTLNGDSISTCGECGNLMDSIRPGKAQCRWCEHEKWAEQRFQDGYNEGYKAGWSGRRKPLGLAQ